MHWILYLITVLITAGLGSFLQAFLHLIFGHKSVGGLLYRNHILFHHSDYAGEKLTTERYIEERASNTAYYVVPAALACFVAYLLLPMDLAIVVSLTMFGSFSALTYFHTQYHLHHSWLGRFRWFRRNQLLHLEHHRDTSKNFAVAGAVWDRIFGTYAPPRTETSNR